jgi:hypothetical protein
MVLQQMVRFKVLDLLMSVLKEFLVLKEEAASAVHGKEGGDDPILQAIAASLLQRKWKEFKQSDESWKESPRFLELGGIDQDISAMVGIQYPEAGLGCWMHPLMGLELSDAAHDNYRLARGSHGCNRPIPHASDGHNGAGGP